MSAFTNAPAEYAYRKRTALTWRQRLSRFLRGERRNKGARKAVSQSPPRLGAIGEDVLRYDTKTTATIGHSSLVSDFATLKFDEEGGLSSGFNLNFDLQSTEFKKDDANGRVNGNGAVKKSGVRSPKNFGPGSRRASGHVAKAPSLDVKGLEEGGFLDTWMKETEKKEQERENAKKQLEQKEESKRASMISSYSATTMSRKQLAEQTADKSSERASTAISREPSKRSPAIGSISLHENVPYNRRSITSEPIAIPGSAYAFGKRKADEQGTGTSPPKLIRASMDKKADTLAMPPPAQPTSSYPYERASPPLGTSSTFRQSLDMPTTDSGRSASQASKRLSTSSMTSFTSGHAQRYEYQRPGASAKIVDSDTVSIASTTTSSRRFEIKTDTGLLKPVTSTSADKQSRQVSHTISRINSNSMNNPILAPGPTSAPRGLLDVSTPRRVVTDTARAVNKPDDLTPSRRLSQPAMRNSYIDPPPSYPLARTPTPESGVSDGIPAPRSRRPSSRLSDRMSWMKDLEDSKNSGRDFVFRKLEGGVASKLAAFEQKATGEKSVPVTPAVGLSRSNSISKSEAYGIERLPSNLTHRTTLNPEGKPGNISDVVDGSFKKKLEDMTGNMAEKLQKKASVQGLAQGGGGSSAAGPSSATRGPAATAAKKRLIPQDVMELIVLSGVDQEVAINEYLQTHGLGGAAQSNLGRTKTWDHEELMKQIQDVSGSVTPKSGGVTPDAKTVEKKLEIPAEAAKAPTAPVEQTTAEKPVAVVQRAVEPEVKNAEPTPAPETAKLTAVEETKPQPAIVPVAAVIPTAVKEKPLEEKKAEETAVAEPSVEDKKNFNAASLPFFS